LKQKTTHFSSNFYHFLNNILKTFCPEIYTK
jgi:hypothetical protein